MRTVATSITFLQSSHILTLKSNVEKNEALCYILLLPKVLIDKHNTEVIEEMGFQHPPNFGDLLHVHTQHGKHPRNFAWWSKKMWGKFLRVRPHPLPWLKFLMTRMLMFDLFAVANLVNFVLCLCSMLGKRSAMFRRTIWILGNFKKLSTDT